MSALTRLIQGVRPLIPDSAAAWGVRKYFNGRYPSLGEMTALQLDTKNKRASIELRLKGESDPLAIHIDSYAITCAEGRTFIEIREVRVSREWINFLAVELLKGKRLEVPDEVRVLL